jgi:hypothetical protein
MLLPKCLSFDDVLAAFACRRYRTAGAISYHLVRNALSSANAFRRSKWYLR